MMTLSTSIVASMFRWSAQDVADAVRRHGLKLKGIRGRARQLDEFDTVYLGTFIQIRDLMHPRVAAKYAQLIAEFAIKNDDCEVVLVGPAGGFKPAKPNATLADALDAFFEPEEKFPEAEDLSDRRLAADLPIQRPCRVMIVDIRAMREAFRAAVAAASEGPEEAG